MFQSYILYSNICSLSFVTYVSVGFVDELKNEMPFCQEEADEHALDMDHFIVLLFPEELKLSIVAGEWLGEE